LKNILVKSHEEALTKRAEARTTMQNYTQKLSQYQTQLTLTNEKNTELKTKISASEEMQRLFTIRLKEVTTLISRKTITS
jgi:ppGpp synthetase/RelA/SpoT-type nucleotidyltranferase